MDDQGTGRENVCDALKADFKCFLMDIFVDPGGSDFDDVAVRVIQLLQFQEWERRDSDNYPPRGYYFKGYASNCSVTLYEDDSLTTPFRCPIVISISLPSGRSALPIAIPASANELAHLVASSGLVAFVPRGEWWRTGWDGAGDVFAS
jgi:hypothetical protein